MESTDHDVQDLCQKVYNEKNPETLAVLVGELHAALDTRANRIRSSTQMTLLHGRASADSAKYRSALAVNRAESLIDVEERRVESDRKKAGPAPDGKIEHAVSRASAIICVLLHCFLPLRLLLRKSKKLNASEALNPITAMAPANKHFSASAKS